MLPCESMLDTSEVVSSIICLGVLHVLSDDHLKFEGLYSLFTVNIEMVVEVLFN